MYIVKSKQIKKAVSSEVERKKLRYMNEFVDPPKIFIPPSHLPPLGIKKIIFLKAFGFDGNGNFIHTR